MDEIQTALTFFDFNAGRRTPLPHLYVYAEYVTQKQVLKSRLDYNFTFITSQELDYKKNSDPESALLFIRDSKVRLTEYKDFKKRINYLVKNIDSGNLDDFLRLTYGEFIYEILGNSGKFLSYIGEDLQNNRTKILLDEKEKEIRDLIKQRAHWLSYVARKC
jgi:hypothetical protein